MSFQKFNLPEPLTASLQRMGFTSPTPIQEQAIPVAMNNRDVLGSAQTGTGKTAAFAIPLVNRLITTNGSAMVLTPTRELAVQVMTVVHQLIAHSPRLKTALLIGGEPMPRQYRQLNFNPRIIVGTPGRVMDHLKRQSLRVNQTDLLVLDEMDRMLDMGFSAQLEVILKFLPTQRQTLMFSATFPSQVAKLAERYLTNPERIEVGGTNVPIQEIKQEVIYTSPETKYADLLKELNKREGSMLVFVKTRRAAASLAERLDAQGYRADAIHGDMTQRARDRAMRGFREQQYQILVATDIASRGLDISHIQHVINFDLPQCPEDYVHRIGRTARAGATGSALTFVLPQDRRQWQMIQRFVDPNAPKLPNEPHPRYQPSFRNSGGFNRSASRRPRFR